MVGERNRMDQYTNQPHQKNFMNADEYIESVQAPGHPVSYPMLIRMLKAAFLAGQESALRELLAHEWEKLGQCIDRDRQTRGATKSPDDENFDQDPR